MNIGTNIKTLRAKKGLTQKDVADKLGVTYQAVSRWENNEVEPSLDIIAKLSEIFDVSVEAIILDDKTTKNNKDEKVENKVTDSKKVCIGYCMQCHKAIFEGDEFKTVGRTNSMLCKNCENENNKKAYNENLIYGKKQRKKGYIFGSLIGIALLVISILLAVYNTDPSLLGAYIGLAIFLPISGFCFTFCACVKNNFLTETWMDICEWGFVRFPGIIFSFDFGGFAFLIVMKILFAILGFMIGCAAAILATVVCLALSLFVFPYAITISYKHPERTIK